MKIENNLITKTHDVQIRMCFVANGSLDEKKFDGELDIND